MRFMLRLPHQQYTQDQRMSKRERVVKREASEGKVAKAS